MAKESDLRMLARLLADRAKQIAIEIDKARSRLEIQQIVQVYNSICTVLDYLNEKLEEEPPEDGKSGPIPKTWNRK